MYNKHMRGWHLFRQNGIDGVESPALCTMHYGSLQCGKHSNGMHGVRTRAVHRRGGAKDVQGDIMCGWEVWFTDANDAGGGRRWLHIVRGGEIHY